MRRRCGKPYCSSRPSPGSTVPRASFFVDVHVYRYLERELGNAPASASNQPAETPPGHKAVYLTPSQVDHLRRHGKIFQERSDSKTGIKTFGFASGAPPSLPSVPAYIRTGDYVIRPLLSQALVRPAAPTKGEPGDFSYMTIQYKGYPTGALSAGFTASGLTPGYSAEDVAAWTDMGSTMPGGPLQPETQSSDATPWFLGGPEGSIIDANDYSNASTSSALNWPVIRAVPVVKSRYIKAATQKPVSASGILQPWTYDEAEGELLPMYPYNGTDFFLTGACVFAVKNWVIKGKNYISLQNRLTGGYLTQVAAPSGQGGCETPGTLETCLKCEPSYYPVYPSSAGCSVCVGMTALCEVCPDTFFEYQNKGSSLWEARSPSGEQSMKLMRSDADSPGDAGSIRAVSECVYLTNMALGGVLELGNWLGGSGYLQASDVSSSTWCRPACGFVFERVPVGALFSGMQGNVENPLTFDDVRILSRTILPSFVPVALDVAALGGPSWYEKKTMQPYVTWTDEPKHNPVPRAVAHRDRKANDWGWQSTGPKYELGRAAHASPNVFSSLEEAKAKVLAKREDWEDPLGGIIYRPDGAGGYEYEVRTGPTLDGYTQFVYDSKSENLDAWYLTTPAPVRSSGVYPRVSGIDRGKTGNVIRQLFQSFFKMYPGQVADAALLWSISIQDYIVRNMKTMPLQCPSQDYVELASSAIVYASSGQPWPATGPATLLRPWVATDPGPQMVTFTFGEVTALKQMDCSLGGDCDVSIYLLYANFPGSPATLHSKHTVATPYTLCVSFGGDASGLIGMVVYVDPDRANQKVGWNWLSITGELANERLSSDVVRPYYPSLNNGDDYTGVVATVVEDAAKYLTASADPAANPIGRSAKVAPVKPSPTPTPSTPLTSQGAARDAQDMMNGGGAAAAAVDPDPCVPPSAATAAGHLAVWQGLIAMLPAMFAGIAAQAGGDDAGGGGGGGGGGAKARPAPVPGEDLIKQLGIILFICALNAWNYGTAINVVEQVERHQQVRVNNTPQQGKGTWAQIPNRAPSQGEVPQVGQVAANTQGSQWGPAGPPLPSTFAGGLSTVQRTNDPLHQGNAAVRNQDVAAYLYNPWAVAGSTALSPGALSSWAPPLLSAGGGTWTGLPPTAPGGATHASLPASVVRGQLQHMYQYWYVLYHYFLSLLWRVRGGTSLSTATADLHCDLNNGLGLTFPGLPFLYYTNALGGRGDVGGGVEPSHPTMAPVARLNERFGLQYPNPDGEKPCLDSFVQQIRRLTGGFGTNIGGMLRALEAYSGLSAVADPGSTAQAELGNWFQLHRSAMDLVQFGAWLDTLQSMDVSSVNVTAALGIAQDIVCPAEEVPAPLRRFSDSFSTIVHAAIDSTFNDILSLAANNHQVDPSIQVSGDLDAPQQPSNPLLRALEVFSTTEQTDMADIGTVEGTEGSISLNIRAFLNILTHCAEGWMMEQKEELAGTVDYPS